ncbi:hypothetical protein GWQ31_19920 [Aeromonas sp. 2MA4]|uniref:hypothetical protein n=1 Tax=Aeromonas sp. 2MA4 TaxID=2699195 RepID=UPI0023DD9E90|nr:hypothetical protein [Aeromonas sp. 2MA4]MDF2393600.1 hypothetical protein [Aeromonas sp. 2MA4]
MTTLFTRTLRAATLGLLLSCSMATFAADGALEIETKVPATLSGKLGYASMKYWVEVPGQGDVEIWTDDEAYAALLDLVGTQVSLEGAMVTFTDGSVYFQPKLAKASAGFTVRKNDEVNFDVLLNGELLTHHDSYAGVDVAHQFAIQGGQVGLIELFSGGVGCPVLYQLVVARQDSPTMISTEFGTCSDQGKLSPDTNGFTLNLPGNPSARWVWDASSLTLRKQS